MSLTESVRYDLKGSAVSSRAYTNRVSPTNGSTFVPENVIRIDIPTGMRNTYLDPSGTFLRFKLSNATVAALDIEPDNSAVCVIRKLELYSAAGSNLLESVDNYNVLSQAMSSVQANPSDVYNTGSVTSGYSSISTEVTVAATPAVVAGAATAAVAAYHPKIRAQGMGPFGAKIVSGGHINVCIPLMSVIGTMGEKYIPLHALASDLRLEITLETAQKALLNTTSLAAVTYTISDLYLYTQMVQLGDEAQAAIDAMTGGVYTWHGSSWRNYQMTQAASGTSFSHLIPARFSSLKGLFITQRRDDQNAIARRTLTNLSQNLLSYYQFRIGSVAMPQHRVFCGTTADPSPEPFMELQRSLHALGQLHTGGLINKENWVFDGGIAEDDDVESLLANQNNSGKFIVGLELESFANKNDVIMSGISTLGQNIFYNPEYASTPVAATLDAFANFDILFTISEGTMTAQF